VTLLELRDLYINGHFSFTNADISAFAPNLASLDIVLTPLVDRGSQIITSVGRLKHLEHLAVETPYYDITFTDKCKIRSMRLSLNSEQVYSTLSAFPACIEELDIDANDLEMNPYTQHAWICLSHLKCLRRLVMRKPHLLKTKGVQCLRIADSVRVIELFAPTKDYNFYTGFPLIVQTTTPYCDPRLTFIARYADDDLPPRGKWNKTKVYAPRVSVRNELCAVEQLMCIEPQ
jgi:hypothetical protein